MNIFLKQKLNKANTLFNNWEVEKANELLKNLEVKYPKSPEVKFHYARTQNSLQNKERALELLERCLNLNPKHEEALCIYPTILIEFAAFYEEDNELIKLKEKFLFTEKLGFEKVGFDLASIYILLSKIEKSENNTLSAITYLKNAKELYYKNDFLKKHHIDSGKIDDLISELKK